MLRPQIPTNPLPTGVVTPAPLVPTTVEQHHAPACTCHHGSPTPYYAPRYAPMPMPSAPRPSIAPYVAIGVGATVAVVAVTAMLTVLVVALAIGACSIAVAVVAIRSALNQPQQGRCRR